MFLRLVLYPLHYWENIVVSTYKKIRLVRNCAYESCVHAISMQPLLPHWVAQNPATENLSFWPQIEGCMA